MTLLKFKNGLRLGHMPAFESNLGSSPLFSDTLERLWSKEDINWMPSANIKERKDDFVIDLAVPGMDKKDFQVAVENGTLTISGERKEEINEETDKVTRREFHYGSFKRNFSLPESINADKISASYKDGLLSLTIAKPEDMKQAGKKKIAID